jgi:hypothetical protein
MARGRDADALIDALEPSLDDLEPLRRTGLDAARRFTFGAYLDAVDALFADRWGLELRSPA